MSVVHVVVTIAPPTSEVDIGRSQAAIFFVFLGILVGYEVLQRVRAWRAKKKTEATHD